jgi:hypothetical protein
VILVAASATCGHGLGPPGVTTLSGTITFQGSWPAGTQVVAVALFEREPNEQDLVYPTTWQTITSDQLPTVDYLLVPPPGRYEYLVVAWIGTGGSIFDLSSWVELGVYTDPGDPGRNGVVEITEGSGSVIDLEADLTVVPPSAGGGEGG